MRYGIASLGVVQGYNEFFNWDFQYRPVYITKLEINSCETNSCCTVYSICCFIQFLSLESLRELLENVER